MLHTPNTPQPQPFSWDITEKPVFANNQKLSNYKAIFRGNSNLVLNVAKQSYTPTTNQLFVDTVHKLSEHTGFPLLSFDEFQQGRKVLAFLECTEPIQVCGHDFKDYMVVGNSHDSSTGFFIGNSNVMIRCQNRFAKVFRQLQVRHTKNHNAEIEQLLGYFANYKKERSQLFQTMERMTEVKIDEGLKKSLIERLTRMSLEESVGVVPLSTRKQNLMATINESIDVECGVLGDNLFGLLNGITHYTTHVRKTKEPVFGNVLGGLAQVNNQAWNFCEGHLNLVSA